ncbi:hypothetical protein ACIBKY_16510 [Nonomuraea sp. NPDC050394]
MTGSISKTASGVSPHSRPASSMVIDLSARSPSTGAVTHVSASAATS